VDADIATVAAAIADPARASMLDALLAGEALTAGELARAAGVAPSTASEHLRRLVAVDLVAVVRTGRHRYHRLTGPDVAAALEALALIAPRRSTGTGSLRRVRADAALTYARTCYDHLAGVVGVAVLDALVATHRLEWRDDSLCLGTDGEDWLGRLDIDVDELRAGRRPMVRTCLDWTTRRPHLAGGLGAAIAARATAARWVVRRSPGHRAVRVTPAGRTAFHDLLDCDLPPAPTA
jgi:DNA-binding transcriptional ArsR family regulator